MTYEKILVPLDGSPLAEAALVHAKAVAARFAAELILLEVVPTFTEMVREAPPAGATPAAAELSIDVARHRHSAKRASAEAYLDRIQESLTSEGLKARTLVGEGDPSMGILDAAKETKSELIVMSTHGRSGIGRTLLGSVSDEVLRKSGLPVLIVRQDDLENAKPAPD